MDNLNPWIKASASQGISNCMEFRATPTGNVEQRDSKHPNGPVHTYTRAELAAFIDGAKRGEFDHLT
jgi:hypothetical protein